MLAGLGLLLISKRREWACWCLVYAISWLVLFLLTGAGFFNDFSSLAAKMVFVRFKIILGYRRVSLNKPRAPVLYPGKS